MLAGPALAQSVREEPAGQMADGRAVSAWVLTGGRQHPIRVRILSLGGIINALEVPDRHGRMTSVVLALPSIAAYEKRPNFSAVIGRYANRISHGGVTIDGQFHKLATNAAGVISHGGSGGLGAQLWQGEAVREPGSVGVRLTNVSPDGFNGFPGELTTTVTYTLGPDETLRIDYTATSTRDTVLNLTHHAFFNLEGAGSGSTDAQWLRAFADHYTPNDAHSLPTGEVLPVSGALDLRRWARIGERVRADDPQLRMAHGFDVNYVLNGSDAALPVAACAYDPNSGRSLVVATDQPGLQVYTANGFDGSLQERSGAMLRQGDAFALETQHFPDSPNHPNFPSTLLRARQTFRSRTEFRFGIGRRGATGLPEISGCRPAASAKEH
ncbi:aldose epimerase family protein [Novosphingobium sp. 9]|uniref:aldose epimerase family protein n=1 Tax=Novosphingobium sp. 9 TaxID=2025349 RepID=UPI0021B651CA|nr:aldose epimerase family protein [Novosphingobium sp. 9]